MLNFVDLQRAVSSCYPEISAGVLESIMRRRDLPVAAKTYTGALYADELRALLLGDAAEWVRLSNVAERQAWMAKRYISGYSVEAMAARMSDATRLDIPIDGSLIEALLQRRGVLTVAGVVPQDKKLPLERVVCRVHEDLLAYEKIARGGDAKLLAEWFTRSPDGQSVADLRRYLLPYWQLSRRMPLEEMLEARGITIRAKGMIPEFQATADLRGNLERAVAHERNRILSGESHQGGPVPIFVGYSPRGPRVDGGYRPATSAAPVGGAEAPGRDQSSPALPSPPTSLPAVFLDPSSRRLRRKKGN